MTHRGLYTALVTPFRNNKVDVDAYKQLIERQIAAGVNGIVPVGTTGESPTMTHEEHLAVIRYAVTTAAGRCQVIAGTGSNSTREAIAMTREAEEVGADGSLQVTPYYNKPSQEGLYLHFKTIAEQTSLPIMLYSIPGRCGIEIAVETAAQLAKDCKNIISIKEAGGTVERVNQLLQVLPESCSILSGDDGLAVPFISCGAQGLVSVTSNLVPAEMKMLVDAALSGDGKLTLQLQKQYYPLMKGLMSLDTNPVPIKTAMAACGWISPEFHLPLVPLSETKMPVLKELLVRFGLLPNN